MTEPLPDTLFEIYRLQKVVNQTLALDIEALKLAGGEIAAIVAPVGSGAETLLAVLTGQARPTVGMVRLARLDPAADSDAAHAEFSRAVGVLFAADSLYRQRSPRGNLLFFAQLRGLPKNRVEAVLTRVGLGDCADTRLDKLPSGLQRRLAFGCAILHEPSVLLLVEPFARCDEASIALLRQLIREEAARGAAALLLVEDTAQLGALCDAVYTLTQGRLVASTLPEEPSLQAAPFKIPVKLEDKVALLNPGDILFAVAQDGKTYLHTPGGPLPAQFTLAELEARLARSGFFRAHRSYLVNLQHVKEVIPYTRNAYTLVLDDAAATEVPLSKGAAAELRELLGF